MRCLFVLIIGVFSMGSAQAFSLSEAVHSAVETNPQINEAEFNRDAVRAELNQAKSLFRPVIDLEAYTGGRQINRPEGLSAANNNRKLTEQNVSASVTFTLFDGFYRTNELYKQGVRIEGAAYRILERREQIALNAIEAYVDVRRHQRALQIASANVQSHRTLLAQADQRYAGGITRESDLIIARERLSTAQLLREDIILALREVQVRFNSVVGKSAKGIKPTGFPNIIAQNLNSALAMATQNSPSLAAASTDIVALEAEEQQALSGYLPKITLKGSASYGNNLAGTPGKNEDLSARVNLSWRLYDGGLRDAQAEESAARTGEAQARRDSVLRSKHEAVSSAWVNVTASDKRLPILKRQLRQVRQVLNAYRVEYQDNARTIRDILDAQNSTFNAEFAIISAEAASIFARFQLMAATSSILPHFGLESTIQPDDYRQESWANLRKVNGSIFKPLR